MTSHFHMDHLGDALSAHGLILRGGFCFAPGEEVAAGPSGAPARSVLLVGHAGGPIWPFFRAWRRAQPEDLADPLDAWSKEVIGEVATGFGARAVFPSDQPYMPFQRWAMRAEGLRPSPLGLLIHPDYGLWHAWRGALLFADEISIQAPRNRIHPCGACASKPCLNSCPAGTVASGGFDVAACRGHLASPECAPCREQGCIARNACPVGAVYRYTGDQQAFHQQAFMG